MSKAWRTLKQGYPEVKQLFDDLNPLVFVGQDWMGNVPARKSLGENVEVEIAYLTEHFLLAWNDWWGLCQRYLRYFGQPDEKLPQTWRNLALRCQKLAYQIVRDSRLDRAVSETWSLTPEVVPTTDENVSSAESLFFKLVTNHRRFEIRRDQGLQFDTPEFQDFIVKNNISEGQPWPVTCTMASISNQKLVDRWRQMSNDVKTDTLWFLRNYQHADLAVSWLDDEDKSSAENPTSAFKFILTTENRVMLDIDQLVKQLNLKPDEQETQITVQRAIQRIVSAIAEIGYDNFVEDVTSDDFLGGIDSPIGVQGISLIPGRFGSGCSSTLLAVSRGDKKAIGFPSIMKQVREHLIRCNENTKVVVVLCDHWRTNMLEENIGDLRAHHERGVRFLFLMVGTPGRVIAPVAVDLELKE